MTLYVNGVLIYVRTLLIFNIYQGQKACFTDRKWVTVNEMLVFMNRLKSATGLSEGQKTCYTVTSEVD